MSSTTIRKAIVHGAIRRTRGELQAAASLRVGQPGILLGADSGAQLIALDQSINAGAEDLARPTAATWPRFDFVLGHAPTVGNAFCSDDLQGDRFTQGGVLLR